MRSLRNLFETLRPLGVDGDPVADDRKAALVDRRFSRIDRRGDVLVKKDQRYKNRREETAEQCNGERARSGGLLAEQVAARLGHVRDVE